MWCVCHLEKIPFSTNCHNFVWRFWDTVKEEFPWQISMGNKIATAAEKASEVSEVTSLRYLAILWLATYIPCEWTWCTLLKYSSRYSEKVLPHYIEWPSKSNFQILQVLPRFKHCSSKSTIFREKVHFIYNTVSTWTQNFNWIKAVCLCKISAKDKVLLIEGSFFLSSLESCWITLKVLVNTRKSFP